MPRRRARSLSPAYARRNARARSLGYKSYYDYRLHGNGALPPDAPLPPRGQRARLRGHRGPRDMERQTGTGDLVIMAQGIGSVERDAQGRYRQVDLIVIDGTTSEQRSYSLRRVSRARLVRFVEALAGAGAIFSPAPSLDVRRLVPEADAG